MLLGMTHGELELVVFVFALIYVAQWVPKAGDWVGALLSRKR